MKGLQENKGALNEPRNSNYLQVFVRIRLTVMYLSKTTKSLLIERVHN